MHYMSRVRRGVGVNSALLAGCWWVILFSSVDTKPRLPNGCAAASLLLSNSLQVQLLRAGRSSKPKENRRRYTSSVVSECDATYFSPATSHTCRDSDDLAGSSYNKCYEL